jgi:hypothetical protein
LKNFGKPIEKCKIENLATLLQLTPLVGFLAMAEKFGVFREIFINELAFNLNIGRSNKLSNFTNKAKFLTPTNI